MFVEIINDSCRIQNQGINSGKIRQQQINFLTTSKEIGVFHYYEKKRKNILPI